MIRSIQCKPYGRLISGLSLLELIVVFALIGVIALIGYPAYSSHILKSHRTNAISDLLMLQLALEQSFDIDAVNNRNRYDFTLINKSKNYCVRHLNCKSDIGRYRFSVELTDSKEGYIVSAQAINLQAKDECSKLLIHSNGRKEPERCWQ